MAGREGGSAQPLARSANVIWRTRVQAFAERPAFRFRKDGQWHSLTWQQADGQARAIAAGLCALGLEPGAKVALLCQTRLEWVLCDVAIAMAGLVSVPIYPSNTSQQCVYVIEDSGASAAIVEDAQQAEKLAALTGKRPDFKIVSIDGPAAGNGVALSTLPALGEAWMTAHPAELDLRSDGVKPEDCFTIIYTSGTTGQPKGVVLTHMNLVSSCESAVRAFDLRPSDIQYLFLPLAHVLGREIEWAPIIIGSEVAFAENMGRIKFDLVEVRPTFMAGVPRIFEKLYAAVQAGVEEGGKLKRSVVHWAFGVAARYSAAVRNDGKASLGLRMSYGLADQLVLSKLRRRLGLDRCRFLICGGAPLSAEIAEFFHGVGLLILEGYGLTETTAAAFVNRWNRHRFGTVGPAIDVIESRMASDGEILLRGPSVFSSYHNNPEATAEAFDAQGWFHTGDIGVIEDGFLRIVDRKKDIIITAGGKNVAPQKLENAIKAHSPLVSQVVVFGDKRPHCVALITPSEPAVRHYGGGNIEKAAASAELRTAIEKAVDDVNRTVASYESVKTFALLPADFSEATGELTPSLKVKREVVAAKYEAVIAGLYAK